MANTVECDTREHDRIEKRSSSLDTHIKYSNLCSHENKIGHKLLAAINKLSMCLFQFAKEMRNLNLFLHHHNLWYFHFNWIWTLALFISRFSLCGRVHVCALAYSLSFKVNFIHKCIFYSTDRWYSRIIAANSSTPLLMTPMTDFFFPFTSITSSKWSQQN